MKEQGNACFVCGEYESAHSLYTLALAASPSSALLYSNRAAAALALGRLREAELDAGLAVALEAGLAKAHFRRAQARLGLGKWEEARESAEEACRLAPGKSTQGLREEIERRESEEKKKKEREKKEREAKKIEEKIEEKKIVVEEKNVVEEKKSVVEEKKSVVEEMKVDLKTAEKDSFSPGARVHVVLPDAAVAAAAAARLELKAPSTGFELETALSRLGGDAGRLAAYLSLLEAATLPRVLGNALTESTLLLMCRGFAHGSFDEDKAAALLAAILRAPRCEMVVEFLGDETRAAFRNLFAGWKRNAPIEKLC